MKKIIKLNESKIRQIVKETIEDEMEIWRQRDESEFGQIISKLDEMMKEIFSEPDEYGFQSSPISGYVTAYALDGNEKYTSKMIYDILENYDMLQEPKVKRLVNKMLKIAKSK